MANRYDKELTEVASKLDEISQSLRWADAGSLSPSPIQKRFSHIVISSAYILAAAALEEYMRSMVQGLCREIQRENPKFSDLRISLLTVFAGSHINSIRDLRDYEKMWEKRVEFVDLFESSLATADATLELPIDGKTIRPIHLETVWKIFGFDGQAFPNALYKASLTDIADGRNDVAHGHISIKKFSQKKGALDTGKKIQRLQDLALHFTLHAEKYISDRQFLRPPLQHP